MENTSEKMPFMENLINIDSFVDSYLETARFVDCEEFETRNFSKQAIKKATMDCKVFCFAVLSRIGFIEAKRVLNIEGSQVNYAASDFYLTRNGHGSGFWDRPEIYGEENAKILTELAKTYKVCDMYVGDDTLLYFY
jgi:hypothetical protein